MTSLLASLLASLGVGLVFRPRLIEGRQFGKRSVGRDKFWKRFERHPEPSRIVHLWREVNVRERDVGAEAIRARPDHGFERGEALDDPMVIPGVDRRLLLFQ